MSMQNILLEAHSGWRYIVILVLAILIVRYVYGYFRGSDWTEWDNRLSRFTPVVFDIQVLLGLILWITMQQWKGFNPVAAWEHPLTMILAAAASHYGRSRVAGQTESHDKFRWGLVMNIVAALLLTIGILRITSAM